MGLKFWRWYAPLSPRYLQCYVKHYLSNLYELTGRNIRALLNRVPWLDVRSWALLKLLPVTLLMKFQVLRWNIREQLDYFCGVLVICHQLWMYVRGNPWPLALTCVLRNLITSGQCLACVFTPGIKMHTQMHHFHIHRDLYWSFTGSQYKGNVGMSVPDRLQMSPERSAPSLSWNRLRLH